MYQIPKNWDSKRSQHQESKENSIIYHLKDKIYGKNVNLPWECNLPVAQGNHLKPAQIALHWRLLYCEHHLCGSQNCPQSFFQWNFWDYLSEDRRVPSKQKQSVIWGEEWNSSKNGVMFESIHRQLHWVHLNEIAKCSRKLKFLNLQKLN